MVDNVDMDECCSVGVLSVSVCLVVLHATVSGKCCVEGHLIAMSFGIGNGRLGSDECGCVRFTSAAASLQCGSDSHMPS